MRLDDYRCTDCGHRFEALLAADEQARCPACASPHTRRQLSAFAIGGMAARSGGGAALPELASYGGCASGMCGR